MRWIGVIALAVSSIAFVPSASAASPAQAELVADAISGLDSADTASSWVGEISQRDSGDDFSMSADSVHGTLYGQVRSFVQTPEGRVAEGPSQEESQPIDLTAVVVSSRGSERTFVVSLPEDASGSSAALFGGVTNAEPVGDAWTLYPTRDAGGSSMSHSSYSTDGPRIRSEGLRVEGYTGRIGLYLWDAQISGTSSSGEQSYASGWTTVPDARLGSALPHDVSRYHYFEGQVENLVVSADGRPLQYWTKSVTLDGPLDVTLTGATGTIAVGDLTQGAADGVVRLVGDPASITLTAPSEKGGPMHVSTGSMSSVFVNGLLVSTPLITAKTGAVAGGITIATAIAFLGGVLYHFKVAPLFPALVRRRASEHGGSRVIAVLRNPTRRKILNLIQEQPGVQPFHVWKQVGGAFGVTLRGLGQLEEIGLVRSVKIGKNRHYYENSPKFSGAEADLLALLSRRTWGETFKIVQEQGPVTQKSIADQLGIERSTVSERLARLEQYGLIRSERKGGTKFYSPSDAAASAPPIPARPWFNPAATTAPSPIASPAPTPALVASAVAMVFDPTRKL